MPVDLENQSVKVEGGVDHEARRSTLSKELVTRIFDDVNTPYDGFLRTVRNSGYLPCLGTRGGPDNKYQWMTYKEVHERATNLGSGLVHLGCEPSQNTFIGIYGPNCTEWDLADLACQMYSMISVPIYDTHGAEGCAYIISHADIETIICDGKKLRFLFDNAKQCEKMKRIIKIDEPVKIEEKKEADSLGIALLNIMEVEQMGSSSPHPRKPGKPDDIMTVCYTSGTTGTPKGVMLTHGNINSSASAIQLHYQTSGVEMTPEDCMISYLPLAHMYERLAQTLCFLNGIRIGFFRGDVKLLLEDIQELKPTIFPSVPRLLTRVYDKERAESHQFVTMRVMAQVSQSKIKSWLFHRALSSKEADLKRGIIRGNTIWDRTVFKKIKMVLGGKVRVITTGAAPLSNKVMTFLRCVLGSCYVVEGYGQTENAAAATFTCINDTSTGHVGPPLSSNMVKVVDVPEKECYAKDGRGEVCLKGPSIFVGYFKAPEKTAETIDKDGWLHTGDIGEWLPNGTLKIVDRVKHIFKLAQGEYLAPEKIENVYLRSRFVAQAFVHGDSLRSFVVAIVIPDQEVLEPWARSKKISGDFAELCENEDVRKAIFEDMIAKGNEGQLNSFEQVKAIYLYKELFSVENGYLTPTFKTKRAVVQKDFQQKFQELYGEVDKRMQYMRSTSFEIQQVV